MRAMQTPRRRSPRSALAGGANFDGQTSIPFLLPWRKPVRQSIRFSVPIDRRIEAWERLASELPMDKLDALTTVAPLEKAPEIGG